MYWKVLLCKYIERFYCTNVLKVLLCKCIDRFYCTNVLKGFTVQMYWKVLLCRATDKARKSVITHWKLVKTHWKNKQGVKIRISISRYALGVQSSAYWLAKLKLWIDYVHLSVHLSTYCQSFPLHYNECMVFQKQMFAIQIIIPQAIAKWCQIYVSNDTKLQICASKQ